MLCEIKRRGRRTAKAIILPPYGDVSMDVIGERTEVAVGIDNSRI